MLHLPNKTCKEQIEEAWCPYKSEEQSIITTIEGDCITACISPILQQMTFNPDMDTRDNQICCVLIPEQPEWIKKRLAIG